MKVQITVDDKLWREAKSESALRGITLGQLVGLALFAEMAKPGKIVPGRIRMNSEIEGSVAQKVEQGATKSGRNPEVGGKVTGSSPVRSSSELKEGYGWCRGSHTVPVPVKLPDFLCAKCKQGGTSDV